MSFKAFIYYCALCGGWAAFLVWFVVRLTGIIQVDNVYVQTGLTAAVLGLCLATAVGSLDARLNSGGGQRGVRVLVCIGVGAVGGLVAGILGEFLHSVLYIPKFIGWTLVGIVIGASIGVFDLLQARGAGRSSRLSLRKTLNGIYGGLIGGLLGGLIFEALKTLSDALPRSALAIGLVVLGLCIGLLIGLAQVILKEAWLRVEAGFKPGRELMLTKDETSIGRAESCDLGLFGDHTIERLHARIRLEDSRYVLADAQTPAGTYVNDQRVEKPTLLRHGDVIRVGNSVLRFGERQKKNP